MRHSSHSSHMREAGADRAPPTPATYHGHHYAAAGTQQLSSLAFPSPTFYAPPSYPPSQPSAAAPYPYRGTAPAVAAAAAVAALHAAAAAAVAADAVAALPAAATCRLLGRCVASPSPSHRGLHPAGDADGAFGPALVSEQEKAGEGEEREEGEAQPQGPRRLLLPACSRRPSCPVRVAGANAGVSQAAAAPAGVVPLPFAPRGAAPVRTAALGDDGGGDRDHGGHRRPRRHRPQPDAAVPPPRSSAGTGGGAGRRDGGGMRSSSVQCSSFRGRSVASCGVSFLGGWSRRLCGAASSRRSIEAAISAPQR